MNEMSVQSICIGDELRQRVQSFLALGPVVIRSPVACELLHHRDRHALRIVGNRLPLRPPCCDDSPTQLGELRLGKIDLKRTNCGLIAVRLLPDIILSCDRTHCVCSFTLASGKAPTGSATQLG